MGVCVGIRVRILRRSATSVGVLPGSPGVGVLLSLSSIAIGLSLSGVCAAAATTAAEAEKMAQTGSKHGKNGVLLLLWWLLRRSRSRRSGGRLRGGGGSRGRRTGRRILPRWVGSAKRESDGHARQNAATPSSSPTAQHPVLGATTANTLYTGGLEQQHSAQSLRLVRAGSRELQLDEVSTDHGKEFLEARELLDNFLSRRRRLDKELVGVEAERERVERGPRRISPVIAARVQGIYIDADKFAELLRRQEGRRQPEAAQRRRSTAEDDRLLQALDFVDDRQLAQRRDRGRKFDDRIERSRDAVHELAEVRQRGDDRVRHADTACQRVKVDAAASTDDRFHERPRVTFSSDVEVGQVGHGRDEVGDDEARVAVAAVQEVAHGKKCPARDALCNRRIGSIAFRFALEAVEPGDDHFGRQERRAHFAETARAELQAPYELGPGGNAGPFEDAIGRDLVEVEVPELNEDQAEDVVRQRLERRWLLGLGVSLEQEELALLLGADARAARREPRPDVFDRAEEGEDVAFGRRSLVDCSRR